MTIPHCGCSYMSCKTQHGSEKSTITRMTSKSTTYELHWPVSSTLSCTCRSTVQFLSIIRMSARWASPRLKLHYFFEQMAGRSSGTTVRDATPALHLTGGLHVSRFL